VQLHRLRVVRFLEWLVFFHLVCIGWLIFRAQSFDQIVEFLGAIVGDHPKFHLVKDMAWRLLVFASPLIVMQWFQHRTDRLDIVLTLPAPVRGAIYAAFLVGIVLFGQFQGNDFIYFQF
jgi:alginate O-acetyltransferase complex protein AlgI